MLSVGTSWSELMITEILIFSMFVVLCVCVWAFMHTYISMFITGFSCSSAILGIPQQRRLSVGDRVGWRRGGFSLKTDFAGSVSILIPHIQIHLMDVSGQTSCAGINVIAIMAERRLQTKVM